MNGPPTDEREAYAAARAAVLAESAKVQRETVARHRAATIAEIGDVRSLDDASYRQARARLLRS